MAGFPSDAEMAIRRRAGYERWRASIPWTDEEIAVAIEKLASQEVNPHQKACKEGMAAWVRQTGRVSSKIVTVALSVLVARCFCGKTALYRYGVEGRCKHHMNAIPPAVQARRVRLDLKNAALDSQRREYGRRDQKHRKARRCAKYGG